jgi:AcrR family transcriptional regulator
MIMAMVEVVAERGYVEASVSNVVTRAGVSRRTFYEQFSNRQDCMLACFRELFERLWLEIDDACNSELDSEAKLRAAIGRALELFAAEPPAARLLTVEIIAAGSQGSFEQHAAIERLAVKFRTTRDSSAENGAPSDADWGLIALVASLVAKQIIAGRPEHLPELERELAQTARALSMGLA